MDPISYEDACRYAGQLFLESRHNLQKQNEAMQLLRDKAAQAERERDEALSLLRPTASLEK